MAIVEAALYVAGKPLDAKTLGSVSNIRSEERVRSLVENLTENYSKNSSALEVVELSDRRYVMQLKPEFAKHVKRLATRELLSLGPLRTLSFIALRQPITQSYVVKVRGKLAYGHIKQLGDLGLVSNQKLGRTKVLRTTRNFADYFNLSQDTAVMKRQIKKILGEVERVKGEKAGEAGEDRHISKG